MQATQQAANRLADRTRRQITALWETDRARFNTLAPALVARANTAGVHLADIGLTAEITRHLRRPTRPLGLRPTAVQVDQSRMRDNITRITADLEQPARALGEWAASEPLLTVATTVQTAMQERGIERWTRGLSGGSCPLCNRWADGIARPVSVPMARHPGCDCIQSPVF